MNDEEIGIVGKEVGGEKSEEVGIESREEMEWEVKEEDIVDTVPTGPGAGEPEAGPEVEVC